MALAPSTGEALVLRISHVWTAEGQITLRLEGQIEGPWVEELRRECARAGSSGDARDQRRLVLDLAAVSRIDATGLALFAELSTRRVAVTNCSPYIAELLAGVRDVDGCPWRDSGPSPMSHE